MGTFGADSNYTHSLKTDYILYNFQLDFINYFLRKIVVNRKVA